VPAAAVTLKLLGLGEFGLKTWLDFKYDKVNQNFEMFQSFYNYLFNISYYYIHGI